MERVYIIGACRTPIGKMGGCLADRSAVDLGAMTLREAIHRAGISPALVGHVSLGCVLQAAQGQNPARQVAMQAGIPAASTALTLNAVCGSGLEAVNDGVRRIRAGETDIVAAGGMESMSNAPFALEKARFGYHMGSPMVKSELTDTMVRDALWDAMNDIHMGVTAENVAREFGIGRRDADEYAYTSQMRAAQAVESGWFREEIVPTWGKKGEIVKDEGIRPDTTMEKLARLRPVFEENGIVTAGNASGINDGAAVVILISETRMRELGLRPICEVVAGAMAGVDPRIMGIGPVYSTRKLLERMSMQVSDIDLWEANEAFAVQSLAVQRELGIPEDRLNLQGGAIALGHPVGASGCRILVTLIHAMKRKKAELGMATLCVGGGMGVSTLVRME